MKLQTSDLRNIIRFFYIFTGLSVFVIVGYCGVTTLTAVSLLWGFACVSFGAVFGFLFGIPKIFQNKRSTVKAEESNDIDYRQQVNTNLTEISDWLTKIIVGLGLINLNAIPICLNNTAEILARSLDASDPTRHKAFALALIMCYLILGFLFGYLSTRLFLQAAFSRADQEAALLTIAETVIATTETRIGNLETKQEYMLSTEEKSEAQIGDPLLVLRNLADNYLSITADDSRERLHMKNQAASAMLNHIRSNKIPKELVFEEAGLSGNEGIILALANYILNYPDKGDLNYLLRIADKVNRLHVRYRIVQAIGELFAKNYAVAAEATYIERIFSSYEKGADHKLFSLIQGTRVLIRKNG